MTTLDGLKYNINQAGKVNMVTVRSLASGAVQADGPKDLQIDATIKYARGACSALFIEESVISGKWLDEYDSKPRGQHDSKLAVKVAHWVPAEEALQIRINDEEWQLVASAKMKSNFIRKATSTQILFSINNITIRTSLGQNIRKVDQLHGYNFLNVEVRGLRKLMPNAHLAGLLAGDDYSQVSQVPAACKKGKDTSFVKVKNQDADGQVPQFMSYASAEGDDFP